VQYTECQNYDASIPLFQAIIKQEVNNELRANELSALSDLFLAR
jgi:hypothetical protein